MGRPTFAPEITLSCILMLKHNYLPLRAQTHPTYHTKLYPYLISHFATMHMDRQSGRRTDTQTNGWLEECSMTVCRFRFIESDDDAS